MADRPRGRPEKATPEVKRLVSEIYVELSKKGERPYVEDVYGQLGVKLAERNRPLAIAKSTVRRIMQELKIEAERTQNEERELDQLWSVGASLTHGISPDITTTLLEIQRWCLLTGQTLTVREARWVAYLQHTADVEPNRWDSKIAALLQYARRYALREKASKLLGKAMVDSSDLDIELMQWDREVRNTAEQTGAISTRDTLRDTREKEQAQLFRAELEKRGQEFDVMDHSRIWSTITSPEILMDVSLDIDHPSEATQTESADTPSLPLLLDKQEQEIYALDINYLSRGPKWDRIPKEARDHLAAELKLEIKKHRLEAHLAVETYKQEHNGFPPLFLVLGVGVDYWKIPDHILKTVGYDAE